MKSARDGWNAAQLASERPLPKPRKVHGPVGDNVQTLVAASARVCDVTELTAQEWNMARAHLVHGTANAWLDQCCADCGYHVCGCKPAEYGLHICRRAHHLRETQPLSDQAWALADTGLPYNGY